MTPETPALTRPDAAARQARQRRWALAAAATGAVGLGAMLGHGVQQSLVQALPTGWHGALGALGGAAVAALLVPLSGWVALRIVAPALPAKAAAAPRRSALAWVKSLRPIAKVAKVAAPAQAATAVAPGAKSAGTASSASPDAQAPARDSLTGAYTQLHFVAAADREWSRIRRHGEDATLLMVDVDHFKRLNDEHGMPCGDAMLVEITRQSSATLRQYDLLARFGGGVLVVYLPHTDLLGALDVAERIRERVVALRLTWQGKKVKATVSVGVAGIGPAHAALDAVIADAGAALREAKAAGRNCVRAAPIPPKHNHSPVRSTN